MSTTNLSRARTRTALVWADALLAKGSAREPEMSKASSSTEEKADGALRVRLIWNPNEKSRAVSNKRTTGRDTVQKNRAELGWEFRNLGACQTWLGFRVPSIFSRTA